MNIRFHHSIFALALALGLTACPPTQPPPPTPDGKVALVTVTPDGASIAIGKTQTFVAVAKDASGNVVAAPTITWNSSDLSKASIDTAGVATGVLEGQTKISATANGIKSNEANLTVTAQTAVIPNTTKVVDTNTGAKLTEITPGGTLKFNGSSDTLTQLQPGNVIVSAPTTAAPDGFLQKVKTVNKVGSEVVVETEPALLTDAISDGKASGTTPLGAANLRSSKALRAGVTVQKANVIQPRLNVLNTSFDKVLFDVDNDPATTNDQIKMSGNIKMDVDLDFNLELGFFKVKDFLAALKINQTTRLEITGQIERSITKEFEVARYEFAPITFNIGPIPIVLNPIVVVTVRLDGTASAKLTFKATETYTGRYGVHFDGTDWLPIFENKLDIVPEAPTFDATLYAKANAYGNFTVKLYGSDDNRAYVSANAFIELDVKSARNPTFILSAGLNMDVGVHAKVLGIKLGDFDKRVIDIKKQLLTGDLAIAPSTPKISSISPINISAFNGQQVATGTITFTNQGAQALTYSLIDVPTWLTVVSGATGSVAQDQTGSIVVSAPCPSTQTVANFKVRSNDPTTPDSNATVNLECLTPSIKISLEPGSIKSVRRGSVDDSQVLVKRVGYTGAVTVVVDFAPTGVTFDPLTIPAGQDKGILRTRTDNTVEFGSTSLTVTATGTGGLGSQVSLGYNVTFPSSKGVLLVDDDAGCNNRPTCTQTDKLSPSDKTFRSLLDQLAPGYDTVVVNSGQNGPSYEAIKEYTTVIWYTGADYGGTGNVGTISSSDEISLKGFLDLGNRKAILLAQAYAYGLPYSSSLNSYTSEFMVKYIGAISGYYDCNTAQFTAQGVTGSIMSGLNLNVADDIPVNTYAAVTTKLSDGFTDDLFTLSTLTSTSKQCGQAGSAVTATGRRKSGAAESSKVLLINFPVENVVDVGSNNKKALLDRLLKY
jgi:Bacterial Ig-like domain (group 2)